MRRAPVICISHGGGPLPLMNHPPHTNLVHSLKTRVPKILRLNTPQAPRAIIVVTAHWEEKTPTISGSERHALLYDYFGFPQQMYNLQYSAPGSPAIAKEIFAALDEAGLKPKIDKNRGWDHGVFIPLMLINPSANIPIIQLSVLPAHLESPASLFRMGKALSQLRDSNVAIIGSGVATCHNMPVMRLSPGKLQEMKPLVAAFSKRLTATMVIKDEDEREKSLNKWREFPGADFCHPPRQADHLFPLIVCAGAAGHESAKSWVDDALDIDLVTYYWDL